MRLFLLLISIPSFWLQLLAQNCSSESPIRTTDHWLFQNQAALKFSDIGVTANTSNNKITIGKASSSISDAAGKLLLFTDGKRVFNGNFVELASDLHGNREATQSSIIVPKPGSVSRYYIFTVDQYIVFLGIPLGDNNGFRFSEIDVIGQGSVIQKNIPLKTKVSEKLTAVQHKNGTDYWVITHDLNSDEFYTYLVNSEGVSASPIVSKDGTRHEGEDFETNNALGYMKTSPDGARLALAIAGQKKIEVFSFDNGTGKVSLYKSINSPDLNMPYGIEFSPDGRFLYVSTINLISPSGTGKLYQYNLASSASPVWLNELLPKDVTALQLGRDGKIYVARYNQNWLGVIQNPKRPGLACNYTETGIQLGNNSKTTMGLPNFVTSFLQTPHSWADPKCMQSPTKFTLLNKANIDSVSWVFNDPGTNPFASTDNFYNHTFNTFGNFQVEITEFYNNEQFGPYKQTITINARPTNLIPGTPDVLWLYDGTHHRLNGGTDPSGKPYENYSWYYSKEINGPAVPISDQGSISVFANSNSDGYYKLMVEDKNCCKNERIIRIRTDGLKTPNAFKPDSYLSDNRTFRPLGGPVSNYVIRIFNRFGQLVYNEENPANTDQGGYKGTGWNGKMLNNGVDCPAGIYVYHISYNIFDKDAYVTVPPKSGIVMLVR